jgi:hypothetical protein
MFVGLLYHQFDYCNAVISMAYSSLWEFELAESVDLM